MWSSCKTAVSVLAGLVLAAGGWWSQSGRVEAAEPVESAGRELQKAGAIASGAIEGFVVDGKGRPIAGACLAVVACFERLRACSPTELLGETTSDARGFYRLQMRPLSPETLSERLRDASVVVSAPGYGVRVENVDLNSPHKMPAIKLENERAPVGGRLVDEKGKPVVGLRVHLRSIGGWSYSGSIESPGVETRAWPQAATTDAEGRFAFHNIGCDRPFPMTLEIFLHDSADNPRTREVVAIRESKDLDFCIFPVVQGTVTCRESGLPIAAANIVVVDGSTIRSSVQYFLSSLSYTKTDSRGRFLLWHDHVEQTAITIEPPDGSLRLTAKQRLPTDSRPAILVTNIALPRGILLRGKVVEAGTGVAVKNAYLAPDCDLTERPMSPKTVFVDREATTDATGQFEILVGPGRGGFSIARNNEHESRSVAWSKIENGVPTPFPALPERGFKIVGQPGSDSQHIIVEVRRLPPAKRNGDRAL